MQYDVLLRRIILFTALCTSLLASQELQVQFSLVSASESSRDGSTALKTIREGAYQLSLEAETIQAVLQERPERIAMQFPSEIPLPSSIQLEPFQVFTTNARTVVRDDLGEREIPFRQQWASYTGKIPGNERAIVIVNFSRLGVSAFFDVGGRRYMIEAATVSGLIRAHTLFPADPVLFQSKLNCGVETPGDPKIEARVREIRSRRLGETSTPVQQKMSGTGSVVPQSPMSPDMYLGAISSDTIEVHVALEGAYDFYQTKGSNEDSATAAMVATAAYSSAIYLRDAQVKLMVPYTRVWTTQSDPYVEDIFIGLTQFINEWNLNQQAVDRSIAHLFVSSENWQSVSGVAGVARLNTLCNKIDGYGITDIRNNTSQEYLMTFTHEVGHNFGAYHTHSCLWPGGPIDFCSEVEGSCYDGPLVGQEGTIMSYCNPRMFEFGPVVSALLRRNAEVAWCAPSTVQAAVAVVDSSFLESLYAISGGSAWTNKTNWTGSVTGRFGVAVRGGRVVSIDLAANNLQGALPDGLVGLTELRRLNLSGRNHHRVSQVDPPDPPTDVFNKNRLTGQLPSNIHHLNKLEYLDVSNNLLTGSIPAEINTLTELRWLNLSENQFTGSIPTSWSTLTNLELLDLSRNQLTGGIPASIGSLSNLRFLILTDMGLLGGSIPAELGNLSKLHVLVAYKLNLTGAIPPALGNLSQLTDLDLGTNKLTGSIPSELGNLSGLENLFLLENQLTGSIPASLAQLDKLVGLNLNDNMLSGAIPEELGNMKAWKLILSENQLTGNIPASFVNLTQVVELDLGNNQFTGTLPESFKTIGSEFYPGLGGVLEFNINDNNFTGPFPDWLGTESYYGTISTLKLGGNNFDATTFPAWVASMPNLGRLWLHDLGLGGDIPEAIGSLTYLYELKLSGNNFESIPTLNNPQLKQFPSAITAVENNKLTFEDVSALLGMGLQNLTYVPQKPLGEAVNLEVAPGSQVVMSVQAGGEGNTYQWFKDGQEISGVTSNEYTINSVSSTDEGEYYVEVKNSAAPLLTLVRNPYIVTLYTAGFPHTIGLISPETGSIELTNPVTLVWNADELSTSYQVNVDTSQTFDSPLLINNQSVADTTVQLPVLSQLAPYYWRVRGTNAMGQGSWSAVRSFSMSAVVSVEEEIVVPTEFALLQNYPNPFNPTTNFEIRIASLEFVKLEVYDLLGRKVATLVNKELQPGSYRVTWDASSFTSGAYLYRMTAGSFVETKRLFLVK